MNPDDKTRSPAHRNDEGRDASIPTGLSEQESLRKDMSYSPASESETAQKQRDPLPETVDDDIDPRDVRAVPGTGGPDDAGDVDVDPDELNLPGREGNGPGRDDANGPGRDDANGLGPDGTIPPDPDGVAAGYTGEPSTFEPEEDQQA